MTWGQPSMGLRVLKTFLMMRINSKSTVCPDVITEYRILNCACFSFTSLPHTPSQLLTSNLLTNNLFIIQKTCCGCNCPSRFRACRNRHVRVPEGLWMADFGAAPPGWRSEKPNMQPVTPVTSNITSCLQSCLMRSWLHPADLRHIKHCIAPYRFLHVRIGCIFPTILKLLTP